VCHARGLKGVALTDALDKRASCPTLPQYGSPEYDNTFLDSLHASIPALLSASAAQDMQEAAETVPATLEVWQDCHVFLPTFQEIVWRRQHILEAVVHALNMTKRYAWMHPGSGVHVSRNLCMPVLFMACLCFYMYQQVYEHIEALADAVDLCTGPSSSHHHSQ